MRKVKFISMPTITLVTRRLRIPNDVKTPKLMFYFCTGHSGSTETGQEEAYFTSENLPSRVLIGPLLPTSKGESHLLTP